MAHRLDIVDCMPDAVSIAQGLLNRPRIPSRRTSFRGLSSKHLMANSSWDDPAAKLESHEDENKGRREVHSSKTWTSSSGDVLSDQDDIDDRTPFMQEYNRLAKRHGVRLLAPDDLDVDNIEAYNSNSRPGGWFSRNILRRTSSTQSIKRARHRRSISDISTRLKLKKDALKDKDLQELVRLCGLSRLYLPAEYASGSLVVPTCFRATAQYLVQHATTARGVFRIPGSHSVITALYNHYCTLDEEGEVIAGTVRCPTLPKHIKCDVHDVASAFKKFLSGLPGGILGSLPLFYAFVSIQNHLQGDPESTKTKQSKTRTRLIALAIWTLRSQYRRELICAVFGLLSMVGRAAETAPREDNRGRPLPTTDLMGYGPLGIVFGPLLVGDILDNYEMRLANPHSGLVLLPASPPKFRRDRHKKAKRSDDAAGFISHVDKVKVANGVMEMLITHWRDVIRHMRDLKPVKVTRASKYPFLRPSASESFALRKPPNWDNEKLLPPLLDSSESPTPQSSWCHDIKMDGQISSQPNECLVVKKQRSRLASSQKLSNSRSMSFLTPTLEESKRDLIDFDPCRNSPLNDNAHRRIPIPTFQPGNRNGIPFVVKRKPCPKIIRTDQSKSCNKKTTSGHHQPQISIGTSKLPASDSYEYKSSGALQSQVTCVTGPLTTGPQLSQSPSNLSVSVHVRRFAASEPSHRNLETTEFPDENIQRNSENSSSRYAPLKTDLTKFSTNNAQEQHHSSPTTVCQAVSVINSPNCSYKLRVPDKYDIKRGSDNSLHSSPRKKSLAPNVFMPNPMRRFKAFSSPHNSPGQTPSAIDGPASVKRSSVMKRVLKSESLPIGANYTNDNDTGSPYRQFSMSQVSAAAVSGSPRVSVKDIAARFNTAALTSQLIPAQRTSPNKNRFDGFCAISEAPKDGVIAPYTSNPPSPTKSQKSGKSDRSNRSLRGPLSLQDPQFTIPRRLSTSRLGVRAATNDAMSLQSVVKSAEVVARPILDELDNQQKEKLYLRKHSPGNFSIPGALQTAERDTGLLNAPKDFGTLDGYESVTKLPSMLPICGTPPPTSHANFVPPRPVNIVQSTISHPQSQVNFMSSVEDHWSPIPTRTNSLLHEQVCGLQKQLDSKLEQIRQLKQQLDNKGSLDIGSLSQQLREAKREAIEWKVRAEIAEKQIEVIGKLSIKSRPSASKTEPIGYSTVSNAKEGLIPIRRIQNTLRMMDGASSAQRSSSLESSDTVLRDLTANGGNFNIWAEQISMDVDSNGFVQISSRSPKLLGFGDSE